jgi:hypothetical protein
MRNLTRTKNLLGWFLICRLTAKLKVMWDFLKDHVPIKIRML